MFLKPGAFGREAIEMRRLDEWMPPRSPLIPTLIVRHHHNDVRAGWLLGAKGRQVRRKRDRGRDGRDALCDEWV